MVKRRGSLLEPRRLFFEPILYPILLQFLFAFYMQYMYY